MPVYNTEKYVGEAIESILKQSFEDFEFIIIDDCSTDNSLQVIHSFSDPRIKVVKNEVNLGRAASDNKAFKLAVGKYIAKMDADDISLPDRFKKQVSFLERNPSIDILGGWMQHFGQNTYVSKYPVSPDMAMCETLFAIPVANPTVMFRKESIERTGLFYNEHIKGTNCEDYDFLARASLKGLAITSLGEVLLRYRVLPVTNSKKEIFNQRIAGACKVRKMVLDAIGFDYSQEELALHNQISLPSRLSNKTAIFAAHNWLTRLHAYLQGNTNLPDGSIKAALAKKWFNLLYVNTEIVDFSTFFKPFLGVGNTFETNGKLKFLIKKVFRKS